MKKAAKALVASLIATTLLIAGCGSSTQTTAKNPPKENANMTTTNPLEFTGEDPTAKLKVTKARVAHNPNSVVPAAGRSLDEQLIQATWDNNLAKVKELVAQGANINYQDSAGETPYLIPTSENYDELLEYFLGLNPDMKIYDSWGGNGIIRAAERGHGKIVARLAINGDDVNRINKLPYTGLVEAIIFGDGQLRHFQTVQVLIAKGADITYKLHGETPLQLAEKHEQSAVIEALRRAENFPKISSDEAQNFLFKSAQIGDSTGIALAVRAGADPHAKNSDGKSVYQIAKEKDPLVAQLVQYLTLPKQR